MTLASWRICCHVSYASTVTGKKYSFSVMPPSSRILSGLLGIVGASSQKPATLSVGFVHALNPWRVYTIYKCLCAKSV